MDMFNTAMIKRKIRERDILFFIDHPRRHGSNYFKKDKIDTYRKEKEYHKTHKAKPRGRVNERAQDDKRMYLIDEFPYSSTIQKKNAGLQLLVNWIVNALHSGSYDPERHAWGRVAFQLTLVWSFKMHILQDSITTIQSFSQAQKPTIYYIIELTIYFFNHKGTLGKLSHRRFLKNNYTSKSISS